MGQVGDREAELSEIFENIEDSARAIISPLLADVAFLEQRLACLRNLPMIEVHPANPAKQRPTQAARQYRETLQQYNSCLKTLLSAVPSGDSEQASPLREYFNTLKAEAAIRITHL